MMLLFRIKSFLLIRISALCIFLLILTSCRSATVLPISKFRDKRHLGSWSGLSPDGKKGRVILYKNGFAKLRLAFQTFGGSKMSKKGALLYQINYRKRPIHLDLIAVTPSYQAKKRIKMIAKFPSSNRMMVRSFFNSERPSYFSTRDKTNTIYLKKIR